MERGIEGQPISEVDPESEALWTELWEREDPPGIPEHPDRLQSLLDAYLPLAEHELEVEHYRRPHPDSMFGQMMRGER